MGLSSLYMYPYKARNFSRMFGALTFNDLFQIQYQLINGTSFKVFSKGINRRTSAQSLWYASKHFYSVFLVG